MSIERCPAQPVPAQVLHEGGEREGRRLDGRRARVPPEEAPKRSWSFVSSRKYFKALKHLKLFSCGSLVGKVLD